MSSLNCLFVVQGEGRGHMTQALALKSMLERAGHRVGAVALSFHPAADLPARRLRVVPPLLRDALFTLPAGRHDDFLLVYLLKSGYAEDVVRWHEAHPEVSLHCFWDRADAADVHAHDETLTFHRLDDVKFLSMMARCRGLVTTAGFETVSEAMYLGRPVLMVPVEGHFEQHSNALDAAALGAGLYHPRFELDRLLAFLSRYRSPGPRFRAWAAQAEERFLAEIEAAARSPRRLLQPQ